MTMTTLYCRVSPRPAALGLNVILGCARMWTERSILVYKVRSIYMNECKSLFMCAKKERQVLGVVTHQIYIGLSINIHVITTQNAPVLEWQEASLTRRVLSRNYRELMLDSAACYLTIQIDLKYVNSKYHSLVFHSLPYHGPIRERNPCHKRHTHKMQTRWYKTQKKPCNWGTPCLPF